MAFLTILLLRFAGIGPGRVSLQISLPALKLIRSFAEDLVAPAIDQTRPWEEVFSALDLLAFEELRNVRSILSFLCGLNQVLTFAFRVLSNLNATLSSPFVSPFTHLPPRVGTSISHNDTLLLYISSAIVASKRCGSSV